MKKKAYITNFAPNKQKLKINIRLHTIIPSIPAPSLSKSPKQWFKQKQIDIRNCLLWFNYIPIIITGGSISIDFHDWQIDTIVQIHLNQRKGKKEEKTQAANKNFGITAFFVGNS